MQIIILTLYHTPFPIVDAQNVTTNKYFTVNHVFLAGSTYPASIVLTQIFLQKMDLYVRSACAPPLRSACCT